MFDSFLPGAGLLTWHVDEENSTSSFAERGLPEKTR
jgi:hypothetical protein